MHLPRSCCSAWTRWPVPRRRQRPPAASTRTGQLPHRWSRTTGKCSPSAASGASAGTRRRWCSTAWPPPPSAWWRWTSPPPARRRRLLLPPRPQRPSSRTRRLANPPLPACRPGPCPCPALQLLEPVPCGIHVPGWRVRQGVMSAAGRDRISSAERAPLARLVGGWRARGGCPPLSPPSGISGSGGCGRVCRRSTTTAAMARRRCAEGGRGDWLRRSEV
jgi:hypothetical protein